MGADDVMGRRPGGVGRGGDQIGDAVAEIIVALLGHRQSGGLEFSADVVGGLRQVFGAIGRAFADLGAQRRRMPVKRILQGVFCLGCHAKHSPGPAAPMARGPVFAAHTPLTQELNA